MTHPLESLAVRLRTIQLSGCDEYEPPAWADCGEITRATYRAMAEGAVRWGAEQLASQRGVVVMEREPCAKPNCEVCAVTRLDEGGLGEAGPPAWRGVRKVCQRGGHGGGVKCVHRTQSFKGGTLRWTCSRPAGHSGRHSCIDAGTEGRLFWDDSLRFWDDDEEAPPVPEAGERVAKFKPGDRVHHPSGWVCGTVVPGAVAVEWDDSDSRDVDVEFFDEGDLVLATDEDERESAGELAALRPESGERAGGQGDCRDDDAPFEAHDWKIRGTEIVCSGCYRLPPVDDCSVAAGDVAGWVQGLLLRASLGRYDAPPPRCQAREPGTGRLCGGDSEHTVAGRRCADGMHATPEPHLTAWYTPPHPRASWDLAGRPLSEFLTCYMCSKPAENRDALGPICAACVIAMDATNAPPAGRAREEG